MKTVRIKTVGKIFGLFLGLILICLLLEALGIVGFVYPKIVENNPLKDTIRVIGITNGIMRLADGRLFDVADGPFWVDLLDHRFGHDLEVEVASTGEAVFYGKEEIFHCGTPWLRLVYLPLIPRRLERFRHAQVGIAKQIGAGHPESAE